MKKITFITVALLAILCLGFQQAQKTPCIVSPIQSYPLTYQYYDNEERVQKYVNSKNEAVYTLYAKGYRLVTAESSSMLEGRVSSVQATLYFEK